MKFTVTKTIKINKEVRVNETDLLSKEVVALLRDRCEKLDLSYNSVLSNAYDDSPQHYIITLSHKGTCNKVHKFRDHDLDTAYMNLLKFLEMSLIISYKF